MTPIVLSIAGSDPSGGAGIQGDARAIAAFGAHALTAITCLTVQGTRGVRAVHPVEASIVSEQLEVLFEDVRVDAVKTGALGDASIVEVVIATMGARPTLPLVVDPVMVSSSGAPLLTKGAIDRVRAALMRRATLVTPNLAELGVLAEVETPRDRASMIAAARALIDRGARSVLAKGGHLEGAPIDLLVEGAEVIAFEGARVDTRCTHGTGCTLASAIAALLARGRSLRDAIAEAKAFVERSMRRAQPIGEGRSPVFLPRLPCK